MIEKKSFPEVMTTEEVVAYLRISRKTINKLVKNKELPAQKIGKNYRFLKSEIDRYLKGESAVNYFKK